MFLRARSSEQIAQLGSRWAAQQARLAEGGSEGSGGTRLSRIVVC